MGKKTVNAVRGKQGFQKTGRSVRGKNPPTASVASPPPSVEDVSARDSRNKEYAALRERGAARILYRALPADVLLVPNPDTPTLLSAARGVITSPDRYDKGTRYEVSRLVTQLETAHGEYVVVAARGGDPTIQHSDLRAVRAAAQAACMQYADRARNALDSMNVSWSGEEDDNALTQQANAFLAGRQAAIEASPTAEEGELAAALHQYHRNRDIADQITALLDKA